MTAYVRGARDYLDAIEEGRGRDELITLLASATGDARETVEQMPSVGIARDARVNVAAMQEEADLFAAHGFLPGHFQISPLVDNQFVDQAASTLAKA
jgi:ABC-type nitrate/sulfonate/bicarbonate transport system substrate-binding protein